MTDRKVRVRFAPSPTGPLHIGGVRTALYNYLLAKKTGGDFILRIEDTDQNRFVPGAEEYIIESLRWLGIAPNEGVGFGDGPHAPYRQSERKSLYRQYADQLLASDHAYYAFDTPEELEEMRERLKAIGNNSPAYNAITRNSMKNSLTLSEDEVTRRLNNGDAYVVRIKLPRNEEVRFHDEIRGWVVVNTAQMDDKVLFKSDGMPTYHLANIVDDYLMQITHVIRGEEWLPSAPLHVMLYRYLGWEAVMPKFAHLPLLLKPEGNGKLSKRDGDRLGFPVFPLQWQDPVTQEISSGYRETGYIPQAVINMLALLGWHPSDNKEMFSMEELIQNFSIERVSKAGAKFDLDKAKWFNQQYLRSMPNAEIAVLLKERLQARGWSPETSYLEAVCGLVKEKVNFAGEILELGSFFFEEPTQYDEEAIRKKWKPNTGSILMAIAEGFTTLESFDAHSLEQKFNEVLQSLNVKSGEMMQPFRLALSGIAAGPPLFEMTSLLGKEKVLNRLKKAATEIQSQPA